MTLWPQISTYGHQLSQCKFIVANDRLLLTYTPPQQVIASSGEKCQDMLDRGVAHKKQFLVGAESYRLQFSMLLHFGLAIFLHLYNLLLSSVINMIARLFLANVFSQQIGVTN